MREGWDKFMYCVYALKSTEGKRIYIGYTEDLKQRLHLHNAGKVKSTKGYKPWHLVYYEAYRAKSDATRRERQLKLHAAKNGLFEQMSNSLK